MQDIKQKQAFLENKIQQLLDKAKQQGATAAAASVSNSSGISLSVRKQNVETIENTHDGGLGITVYVGQRKGSASTSDMSDRAIEDTVKAAINIAKYTSEDEYSGLADAELMATEQPDLDLYHPWDLEIEQAIDIATRCEAAGLDFDDKITNTEGATLNSHSGLQVYGNSHGFIGGYPSTQHSLSCSFIGQQGDSMQRDYWYSSERLANALDSAEHIGKIAAERTIARLGAQKIDTCEVPVIFQADVAGSLIRSLTSAISGGSIYRKSSFLLNQLDQSIFPDFVTLSEHPLIAQGASSSAFDSEGVATYHKNLIENGVLQTYLLSSYSARKLGLHTTANAGGTRNLRLTHGDQDLDQLIKHMHKGLLVTEMMGQGSNLVTGDYSRGASGFWIEQGEIQYPVEEITIAGNLKTMFQQLLAVGSDIETRGSVHTGSWLIENMMISGN